MLDVKSKNYNLRLKGFKSLVSVFSFYILAFSLLSGCVERKLSIRTDPPDAVVYLDGEKVGKTPCDIPFTFYGTRQLTIGKEGYTTINKLVEIPAPLYDTFPVDFIFDVLVPAKIKDIREFDYTLKEEKLEEADEKAVFQNAKELKERAFQEDKKP